MFIWNSVSFESGKTKVNTLFIKFVDIVLGFENSERKIL